MENNLKEKLAFKCRACGKKSPKNFKDTKGFEIVAIEDIMDWSDFTEDVPDLDVTTWERTSVIPQKGDIKKVQVYFPFNMSTGETFWTFFRPALSQFNGWEDYPSEIDFSALVRCKFESIISKDDSKAWINLYIEESIPINEFPVKFPTKIVKNYLQNFKMFRRCYVFKYKNWILFNAGSDGNIGIWALIKNDGDKNRLLAFCDWNSHYDRVYCGNVLIDESEVRDLIEYCIYD